MTASSRSRWSRIDGGVVEFCKQYLPGNLGRRLRRSAPRPGDRGRGRFHAPECRSLRCDHRGQHRPGRAGRSALTDTLLRPCPGDGLRRAASSSRRNGVPLLQGEELRNTMRAFRALFSNATCYPCHDPHYAGGPMALGWGTDGDAGGRGPARRSPRGSKPPGSRPTTTRPAVHLGAFALRPMSRA